MDGHRGRPGRRLSLGLLVRAALMLMLTGMGGARTVWSAEPHELARLVGKNVGLYVELRSPADQFRQLETSPLAMRLQTIRAYQRWLGSAGFRQLRAAGAYIETLAEKPFRKLIEDLFGQSVVIAIYPGDGQKPAVLLLTRAASEDDLSKALEVWQQVDERTATSISYSGDTYYRWSKRSEKGEQEVQFYWTSGRTLCLSNSENALRTTIDLARRSSASGKSGASLADAAPFRSAVSKLAPNVAAVVYLNPRAWDRQVVSAAENRLVVDLWRRCESAVLSLAFEPGVRVTANVRWRRGTGETRTRETTVEPLAVMSCLGDVPADALVAACGKLRLPAGWIDRLIELAPASERRQAEGLRRVLQGWLLGLDLFDEVLPRCRGQWAGFVVPSKPSREGRLPVDAAVRIPVPGDAPGAHSVGPPVAEALDNALSAGANLLGAIRNAESTGPLVVLQQEDSERIRLRWLDGLKLCAPTYGWADGTLYLATSPTVVRT
ncbi:MAG TPA: hypothetical protein EYP14_12790, partial [Planctomycetaceae bacterium]|nr:hypothetical protein [Planctomycetaceae bacterium]